VLVAVRDSGPGLDAKHLERIFDDIPSLRDDFILDDRLVGKSKPLHHSLGHALAAPAGEGEGIRQYWPNFLF
jgi:hypothetical protein